MPVLLEWHEAVPAVRAAARERADRVGRTVAVGITGPVGAGKSSLARALGGTVVSTDGYLPDYEAVTYEQRDLPGHADLQRLSDDIRSLRATGRASVPVWSFLTHRREGYREVEAGDLLVVEGIHALHDLPFAHLDLAVYIEAPAAIRWSRWEALEACGERGWGVEAAREYFERVAEPTFMSLHRTYRDRAGFVVLNSGPHPGRPEGDRPAPS